MINGFYRFYNLFRTDMAKYVIKPIKKLCFTMQNLNKIKTNFNRQNLT